MLRSDELAGRSLKFCGRGQSQRTKPTKYATQTDFKIKYLNTWRALSAGIGTPNFLAAAAVSAAFAPARTLIRTNAAQVVTRRAGLL